MLDRIKKWLPFKRGDESARRVATGSQQQHSLARLEQDLHRLVGRIGSLWSTGDAWPDLRPDSFFGDFSAPGFSPTLDLADKRKHLELTLELPGMEAEDIHVDVRGGNVVIRGEKRFEEVAEEDGYYRTERSFGAFERVVPLPAEVEAERTEASFKNGVLTIRLPKTKSTEIERRRVPIKIS